MPAVNYGAFYWVVKTKQHGTYSLFADDVKVTEAGALEFLRNNEGKNRVNFCIAPGEWELYFAASMIDGGPVAVEGWNDSEETE